MLYSLFVAYALALASARPIGLDSYDKTIDKMDWKDDLLEGVIVGATPSDDPVTVTVDPPSGPGRIKVLLCHGGGGRADVFEGNTQGALQDMLFQLDATLVYVQAPNEKGAWTFGNTSLAKYSWMLAPKGDETVATIEDDPMLSATLATFSTVIARDGPFDGIVTFSQGPCDARMHDTAMALYSCAVPH